MTTRRFDPYPAYKDSGVEWLGAIPAHWEPLPLGRLGQFSASGIDKKTVEGEDTVFMVNYTDVYSNLAKALDTSRDYMQTTCPSWKALEHSLIRGDILFTPSSETEAEVGFSAVVMEDMPRTVYSYHLIRLRPAKDGRLDLGFSKYLCNNRNVLSQFAAACKGTTRQILTREDFRTTVVLLPPVGEQRAIAAFLDRETARIDTLVVKKERLIALLQEQRTALITGAITKGLDPTVHMKDSGVEWLGEIPAHWEVKPLKHIANFINGFAFKPDEWGLEGTPIIRIENLNGGDAFNCTTRQLPTRYCAEEGDLLFGWSGNRGTSFGPFLWWRAGKHYVNQHIFRIVDYEVDKLWLFWALRAVTFYVEKQAHGIIGMVHVTRGELGSIPIPVVRPEEQVAIARRLQKEHTRIDALVGKVHEAIERLKELRTALISAAVTGKIDVREEAA